MMKKIFERFSNKKFRWLLGIVGGLIVLYLFAGFLLGNSNFSKLLNWADPENYQAVFLSNGQVYFGRVDNVNRDTLVLKDIYYIRMPSDLQTGSEADQEANFSLIKLGQEVHGPKDSMNINIAQILFVEDLRDDSKVVEAIRNYRNNK